MAIYLPVILFFGYKMKVSYDRYIADNGIDKIFLHNINVGTSINDHAKGDETVIINSFFSPEVMYYSRRNYFVGKSVKEMTPLLIARGSEKGIFFNVEFDHVKEIYRFDQKGDSVLVYKKEIGKL